MWILFLTSAWGADVSGYAEMQGRWVSGVEGTPWQATQRFRPSLEAEAASWVRLHVTVEATYWEGRDEALEAYALVEEEVGTVLETSGCPLTEPESGIHDIDEVLGVERLYADFYTSFADIRVGRQALNWGSALGLNPTDLFAEVLVAEPWRERRGVNAIRANFPVGDRHQVVDHETAEPGYNTMHPHPKEPTAEQLQARKQRRRATKRNAPQEVPRKTAP